MKRLLSALLALTLAVTLCVTALADGDLSCFDDYKPRALADGETLRRGIDVSQFQKEIDWKAVADSGVDFAIIRVAMRGWGAEGRLLNDTRFKKNLSEAHENGILVGAYIYSQAITIEEAREEARYLVEAVKDYTIDLPLVFDQEFAEQDGSYVGRLYTAQLSRQEMTDICNAFCAEVELLGYDSMVYSNPYTLNTHLYADQLGRLWLAHFVKETNYQGSYEFWQCGIANGLPGIATDVDLDFWFAGASEPMPVMRFTDVPTTHWAYLNLRAAVRSGWIKGYPDNTFRPEATLTRADFVTMLARLSGEPLDEAAASAFPDVAAGQYYAASVAWAVRSGIVSGFPDGTFHPAESITRQQMARIMTQYLKHIGRDTSVQDATIDSRIADRSAIGDWALNDVRFCYSVGLLNGRGSSFVPAGTATRAEAGTVLARLYRYMHGELEQPKAPAQPTPPPQETPEPYYGVVLSLPEVHIAG